MNWNDFKATIYPIWENLLLTDQHEAVGWKQEYFGYDKYYWIWNDDYDNPCKITIEQVFDQLDPEFQEQLLQCNPSNYDHNLDPKTQIKNNLYNITWKIIKEDLTDLIDIYHEIDYYAEPNADHFTDDEEYAAELTEYIANVEAARDNFNKAFKKFQTKWNQLAITEFYHDQYKQQNTTKVR